MPSTSLRLELSPGKQDTRLHGFESIWLWAPGDGLRPIGVRKAPTRRVRVAVLSFPALREGLEETPSSEPFVEESVAGTR